MKRYYITDRNAVGGFRTLLDIIRDQMVLGVDMIQIREKDLTARQLFEFTLAVLEVRDNEKRKPAPPKILVNTRADVAKAAHADGVHLPSDAASEWFAAFDWPIVPHHRRDSVSARRFRYVWACFSESGQRRASGLGDAARRVRARYTGIRVGW